MAYLSKRKTFCNACASGLITAIFLFVHGGADAEVRPNALASIKQLFLEGAYDRVVLEQFSLDPESRKKEMLEAYYYIGTSLLYLKRYTEARNIFLGMLERSSDLAFLDHVEMRLADIEFAERKYEEALTRYARMPENFPDTNELARAYEQAGRAAQHLGRFEEADSYFKLLQLKAPLSFEATHAREGRTEQITHFGVQVGSFVDPLNADQLKTELEQRGFFPVVITAQDGNILFYRVRLGRFSNRREAEILARQVEALGYPVQVYP